MQQYFSQLTYTLQVSKSFNVAANDNHVWRAKCSLLHRYCFIRLKLGLKEKEGIKEEEDMEAKDRAISWKEVFKQSVKKDDPSSNSNYKELWESTAEQRRNYFEETYGEILAEEEESIKMGDTFVTPSVCVFSRYFFIFFSPCSFLNSLIIQPQLPSSPFLYDLFPSTQVASVIACLQRGGAQWADWGSDQQGTVVVDDLDDGTNGDDDYELQLALALSLNESQDK